MKTAEISTLSYFSGVKTAMEVLLELGEIYCKTFETDNIPFEFFKPLFEESIKNAKDRISEYPNGNGLLNQLNKNGGKLNVIQ